VLITWAIIYLDRTDEQRRSRERQFQDRHLYLDTSSLDPATKAAVEYLIESGTSSTDRAVLKYRHLFHERKGTTLEELMVGQTELRGVSLLNCDVSPGISEHTWRRHTQ